MDWATQRRFIRAIHDEAKRRGDQSVMGVSNVMCLIESGWAHWDGERIVEHGAVVLTREAARAYLADGTPWTEADVVDRIPAEDK